MDAILLDGIGNIDQAFVNHRDKGDVVLGGEIAEDLLEGVDVVGPIVGRKGNACEQNLDVGRFKAA